MKHALFLNLLCLLEDMMLNVAVFGSPPLPDIAPSFFFFFPIFLIVCVGQQPWHDLACDVELTGVTLQSMQCVVDTEANIYAPELDIYGLVFYPSLRTWLHLSLLLWKTVTEHRSRLQKQTLAKMWRDCWDNTSHRRLIHDPMFGGCGLISLRSL